jgi:hypothetical protein
MGLDIDSFKMEARLPAVKITKIKVTLTSYKGKNKIKICELLIGLLNFVANWCYLVEPF